MDRATKVAVEKYPHGKFDGEVGDSLRAACAVGYMQAEKDLALTPEDIKRIVDLYDECLSLTFEEGKPAYESEDFYAEVLRRFLEQRKK